jgi:hypothetical protein
MVEEGDHRLPHEVVAELSRRVMVCVILETPLLISRVHYTETFKLIQIRTEKRISNIKAILKE